MTMAAGNWFLLYTVLPWIVILQTIYPESKTGGRDGVEAFRIVGPHRGSSRSFSFRVVRPSAGALPPDGSSAENHPEATPEDLLQRYIMGEGRWQNAPVSTVTVSNSTLSTPSTTRKDPDPSQLQYHLQQQQEEPWTTSTRFGQAPRRPPALAMAEDGPERPQAFYPHIDLSIPDTVYRDDGSIDLVWDLLKWEAYQQAQREPLLVSFMYATILNHDSLESSLSFLLANRLQSPGMMISTQLQSIFLATLQNCAYSRRCIRADIMAVRDRDPACHHLPDVFLYFKGFHALQAHRVAHILWRNGKQVLAQYLQSQVSQIFQIDIHPNATLGKGIMLDHGTGIVIGETAVLGHNCSVLHHVTLGGSGKKGVIRHPQVGDGVLLGAGVTILGAVTIGAGSQVGAGTLVVSDLPPHSVAVGVPARILGSFVDVTEQPSVNMDQLIMENPHPLKLSYESFESSGI